ncbi:MAG TPA: recombinase family protein [Candidatus Limnocylindrales bacterium]|nr:recombinase family protein [Candidatus Limnocylindrales bacterium]
MLPTDPAIQARAIRCAIYTRKSTEEGLAQEFNSLDAQRECAEAYIRSQSQQGWVVLPERYDDGGYTGANIERPALQRLLRDIQAGAIDVVVIYKVDRLSRSLFDFAGLMRLFDSHGVSFVSVTQQFNSSTPMGRLTLNILLSFAEFERLVISERTRDKVSAARKKGKWMGGMPVLGYDPDRDRTRLVVNEVEAAQVREIFAIFLRERSLVKTLEEIERKGWTLKSWTTRKGEAHTGRNFDRHSLTRLLSNVLYLGEVPYKGEVYRGEHAGIVQRKVWKQVNRILEKERRQPRREERNLQGALLKGVLQCARCGRPMIAGYTTRQGRRYAYYVCTTAQKRGARACAGGIVSKERIEAAVADALFSFAESSRGRPFREQLPINRESWDASEASERQRIIALAIGSIEYDRRTEQGRLRLRAAVAGGNTADIPIHAGRKPLVERRPPEKRNKTAAPPKAPKLPRITKLMALAIRLEELLQ